MFYEVESMIDIKAAGTFDFSTLLEYDKHITRDELDKKIRREEIIIAQLDGTFLGWLRWSLFWDEIPFINMLGVLREYRGNGIGTLIVTEWERLMSEQGFSKAMVSTLENESAQHFYRKLGYRDLGRFLPFENEYELILGKEL